MNRLQLLCCASLVALGSACMDTEPAAEQALPFDHTGPDQIVSERPTVEADPAAAPAAPQRPDPRDVVRGFSRASARIAHVECDSAEPREAGGIIVTDVSCRVLDPIAGAGTARVSFTLPGGRIGDREHVQSHVPRIARGERGVVFMTDRDDAVVPAIAWMPEQPDGSFGLGPDTFSADSLRALAVETVR